MPIVFGLLASLGIGAGDYFGRYCTRRANATTTVLTALVGGLVAVTLLTVVVPSERISRDLWFGAGSGLTIGFALMFMYQGMAISSTAIVSPVVAFFVAFVPLVWDLTTGGSLPASVGVGVGLAVVGIVVTTVSPDLGGRIGPGLAFAVASGALFGIGMTVVGETSIDSGVWPAVSQRGIAWLTLVIYGASRELPLLLPRPLMRRGLLSGVAGTGGMAMFILGAQRGSLGSVAVASSMFPAVTAVLAYLFDNDQLRWWQSVGIGVALVGVGLIAAG
ncbi:MAG: DMT family transporter [Actinomycetia bacterium]|nr:DMT family transporter [Actinomycetes bacterium]